MAVPSTLHQKVQLGLERGTVTLYGDSGIRPHSQDNAPLLEIMHDENDLDLAGFSFNMSSGVCTLLVDDDYLMSTVAIDMMRRMQYMPGMGLGRNQHGVTEIPRFRGQLDRAGLGYDSKKEEGKISEEGNLRPIHFISKVALPSYNSQPKPFVNKENNKKYAGFEIFATDTWDSDDEWEKIEVLVKELKADWTEALDGGVLMSMYDEVSPWGKEKDEEMPEVMMLGQEAPKDPSQLIVNAVGEYKNCTFTPVVKFTNAFTKSVSEFESEFE